MKKEKYGFVYIWHNKYKNKWYIGCHWGTENDSYICSSSIMKKAYLRNPSDFRRRILGRVYSSRKEMLELEHRWLQLIPDDQLGGRYYNLQKHHFGHWSATPDGMTVAQRSGATRRGRKLPCSPEKATAISKAKKGKKLTPEHRSALSTAAKKKVLSAEHKSAISAGVKKSITPEMVAARTAKIKGKRRKIILCPICSQDTGSPRRSFCPEHRYTGMNLTRSSLPNTKWFTS
jgi:hypothetical protein